MKHTPQSDSEKTSAPELTPYRRARAFVYTVINALLEGKFATGIHDVAHFEQVIQEHLANGTQQDCALAPFAPSPEGPPRPKRRRGQQPGAKGPRRQLRADLPEQIINHTLEHGQLICPGCGKVRPELRLREESQEIGWEVRLVRRRHVRFRYGPSCQ